MNLREKMPALPRQAVSMTHEQALHIIERAQQDKYLARELDDLRDKCCVFVNQLMHEVGQDIARREKKIPALLRSTDETAVSLRGAAQRREQRARQRRELAEAMVVGALLNSDNPHWNPLDPSTHCADRGGLLMALLKTSKEWIGLDPGA